MRLRPVTAVMALAAAAAAAPAHAMAPPPAAVFCNDSVLASGAAYLACQGPIVGNDVVPGQASTLSFDGWGSFDYVGMTGDDSGAFADKPAGARSGTLTLGSAQTGLFVVALKGGPSYSLYLFDGGSSGISSLAFDTRGIVSGTGRPGPVLSNAMLFTATAVPEPGSAMLLLAGLGAVGFVARRRSAL